MWKWLGRPRLLTQLEEICAERRSLRLAEHRHSLRVKRAAVRSRILYEIQKKRMQEAGITMMNAKTIARYEAAQRVLGEHEKRHSRLAALLRKRGLQMPERTRPRVMSEAERSFKDKLFKDVEGIMSENGGVLGKTMGRDALKDSFGKLHVNGNEKEMAAGLVAGVAKEIGLTKEELGRMVEMVEKEGDDVGLQRAVMDAMEKEHTAR